MSHLASNQERNNGPPIGAAFLLLPIYTLVLNPRGTTWYRFILWIATHIAFGLLGGFKVRGREHIPPEGPIIFAPNHMSYLDPPLIACSQPRALAFMAKEQLFKVPILGWLIRSLDAFPIRRGKNDMEAIKYALRKLSEGAAVLVFPEGTRGDGVTLGPMTPGVAMLAKKSGAVIVPAAIIDTQKAWPKGSSRIRRQRVQVIYGEPFTYKDVVDTDNDREARDQFASYLKARILKLCQEGGLNLKSEPPSSSQLTNAAPDTEAAGLG